MLKSSSNKRDFKKVVSKVGRKIAKTGVNNKSIKVSTKRLQLAEQLRENDVTIQTVVTKLTHYSGVARLTGIHELKNIVLKLDTPDEYVSLIMPPSLENLFDEEADTRKALIEFYSVLFSACSATSFTSVMPVVITYLSSGLTNLSRGIRGAALQLLHIITTTHPTLLVPYHSKMSEYLLSMFKDTSQMNSSINNYRRESKGATANDKATEVVKSKITFFSCILQVFQSFFRSSKHQGWTEKDLMRIPSLTFDPTTSYSTALITRVYASTFRSASLLNNSSLGLDDGSAGMSSVSVAHLCTSLTSHWSGLTLTEGVLPNESIVTLLDVCAVCLQLSSHALADAAPAYLAFISGALAYFPYSSKEAAVAVPNSATDKFARALSQTLNVALCELILQLPDTVAAGEYAVANGYLTTLLEDCAQSRGEVVGPQVEVERLVRALGLVLARSNRLEGSPVSTQTLLTLRLYRRVLDLVPGSDPSVIAICSCTCDFAIGYTGYAGDFESSGLCLLLLDLLYLFIQIPSLVSSGFYSERVTQSLLQLVQKFPMTDEVSISRCSEMLCIYLAFRGAKALYIEVASTVRTTILDTIYYCSPDSLTIILPLLQKVLVDPSIEPCEITYFCNILFARRQEIGLEEFIEFCFTLMCGCCKSLSVMATGQIVTTLSGCWVATDIASILIRSSSSDKPHRILNLVLPQIESILAGVTGASCDLKIGKQRQQLMIAFALQSLLFQIHTASAQPLEDKGEEAVRLRLVERCTELLVNTTVAVTVPGAATVEACFGSPVAQLTMSQQLRVFSPPPFSSAAASVLSRYLSKLAVLVSTGNPSVYDGVCTFLLDLVDRDHNLSVVAPHAVVIFQLLDASTVSVEIQRRIARIRDLLCQDAD